MAALPTGTVTLLFTDTDHVWTLEEIAGLLD